ncbi:unnamed protein product [Paramecium primaurelia]|uniref:Uncharacterized protein n=1 Tax=Paramecium primaurelia TaxID=5886 RepID=A0A8S1NFU3_PARPR|nr:unnamed protein product [Paramecium primaurelia]
MDEINKDELYLATLNDTFPEVIRAIQQKELHILFQCIKDIILKKIRRMILQMTKNSINQKVILILVLYNLKIMSLIGKFQHFILLLWNFLFLQVFLKKNQMQQLSQLMRKDIKLMKLFMKKE